MFFAKVENSGMLGIVYDGNQYWVALMLHPSFLY